MGLLSITNCCRNKAMGRTVMYEYQTEDLKRIFNTNPTDYHCINSNVKRIFHDLTMQELMETEISLSRWQWFILILPSVWNFSLFTFAYQELTFQLTAAAIDRYVTRELALNPPKHIDEEQFKAIVSKIEITDKLDLYKNPTNKELLMKLVNRFFSESHEKEQPEAKEQQAEVHEKTDAPSVEELIPAERKNFRKNFIL